MIDDHDKLERSSSEQVHQGCTSTSEVWIASVALEGDPSIVYWQWAFCSDASPHHQKKRTCARESANFGEYTPDTSIFRRKSALGCVNAKCDEGPSKRMVF